MKRIILGIILAAINLILIVSGITCLIAGYTSNVVSAHTEALIVFGFIGLGACIGTVLSALALLSVISGYEAK